MSTLARNSLILLVILAVCLWAIIPPEKKLRLGKDVAGGVSLVYQVDIKPGDDADTLSKVSTNAKERLDPAGVLEISVVPTGSDRIEITMPLPSERVIGLKQAFETDLAKVGTNTISRDELERIAVLPEAQRGEAVNKLAAGDKDRADKLNRAILDFEAASKARADYEAVDRQLKFLQDQIRAAGGETSANPVVPGLRDALKQQQDKARQLVAVAAGAEKAYEDSIKVAVSAGLNPADVRRALLLSDKPFKLNDRDGKIAVLDSPRKRAIDDIVKQFPDKKPLIDKTVETWNAYEAQRSGLDDPEDVVRILKGAGVLTFRISVRPGEMLNESELRQQLRVGGPASVKSEDARFFRVNKIEQWVNTVEELEALKQSASAFFANRRLVAEEYKGSYYVLCWDKRGMRLTPDDGQWALAKAYQGVDQLGRPAIDFEMDTLGSGKLGKLTGDHVGQQMAVLLDDEVYTAPTLQSTISSRGQITGTFSAAEIDYIVRVLSAGSLKAKLSAEPISRSVLGPSLGKENLVKGLKAGVIAFVVVGGFMIVYYFACGAISVVALMLNALMIVAAMALNQAAFTLPGIAGIILTFGMAVDANVLIYERMREEMNLGHDLRTAIRLGYGRALSAIVDGHVTSLIAAVVLGFTGTQEIKGFALTLGIGIVASLFSQLFATRFIFTILVEKFHWRRISMLSMAMGWKLQPRVDWMGIRFFSYVLSFGIAGMGIFFLFYEGKDLLGTEFRGGTAVTLVFKNEAGPQGQAVPVTMTRSEVEERIKAIGKTAGPNTVLKEFDEAEVIAVNPLPDGKQSQTFQIKTLITDAKVVQDALIEKFRDKLDVRQAEQFDAAEAKADRAPVFPMSTANVGEAIETPGLGGSASEFEGGLAIRLDNIHPPISKAQLDERLAAARRKVEFADIGARPWESRVLKGSDAAVTSAVVLVRDPEVRFEDRRRWEGELRDREWALTQTALTQAQTLAEVQSFSPAVASTFRAQAITAVLLSTLMIVVYVWVRFNSFRYSAAAIVCTLHDCLVAIGFVALATVVYRNFPDLARMLGILPFKVDLNVVAAVLTILGYSLNDTIIIMDRVRENRGKLPYATRKIINDAINQTISRTIITAGTTFLATTVLYIVGGEGVRVFAYTMLIGILVGTYSSIAVAAPLLWAHHREDEDRNSPRLGAGSASAAEPSKAAA